MQKLKEQRATPPEKFVLETIKGAKASEPKKMVMLFGTIKMVNGCLNSILKMGGLMLDTTTFGTF